jgi:Fe2+ or Zn2+ uptake regulation protein
MQKRNTAQKKAIFSSLSSRTDHPSATRLYEDLKEQDPSLSKATVYRVLKNAADEGEVLRLHVGAEDRFDGDIRDHMHLICTHCNAVLDAPFPTMALSEATRDSGFQVEARHVTVYGVCPQCQKNR